MRIVLIPCGTTEWHTEGRLLGRVEVPLSPAGEQQCCGWAESLRAQQLERIYHAPDELCAQTAHLLARRLGVPARPLDELVEVDVGLWAGLTDAQLKTRFASAHRGLHEDPLRVQAPGGESLAAAAERLEECICRQVRKNGRAAIGVVARPLSFVMLKCALEGGDFSRAWETAQDAQVPVVLDCDPRSGRANGKGAAGAP